LQSVFVDDPALCEDFVGVPPCCFCVQKELRNAVADYELRGGALVYQRAKVDHNLAEVVVRLVVQKERLLNGRSESFEVNLLSRHENVVWEPEFEGFD
jgi:hypothetical protein